MIHLLDYNLLLLLLCRPCWTSQYWNYDPNGEAGPAYWAETFAECGGMRQSPISIPRSGLQKASLPPLVLENYDLAPEEATLINNGHTVKLEMKPYKPEVTPVMSGGGLQHKYRLAQAHFHWGSSDLEGSEHQKSHTPFPMEMHLVHFKDSLPSIGDALAEGEHDSLAVLSVFVSVQLKSLVKLPSLDLLIAGLPNITEAGSKTKITSFPMSTLLPSKLDEFYRYNGSLTTPGCQEYVQWTVLKNPIFASLSQLMPFRDIKDADGNPLVDNFRPVQPLNGRQVLEVTTSSQSSSVLTPVVLTQPVDYDHLCLHDLAKLHKDLVSRQEELLHISKKVVDTILRKTTNIH